MCIVGHRSEACEKKTHPPRFGLCAPAADGGGGVSENYFFKLYLSEIQVDPVRGKVFINS